MPEHKIHDSKFVNNMIRITRNPNRGRKWRITRELGTQIQHAGRPVEHSSENGKYLDDIIGHSASGTSEGFSKRETLPYISMDVS